MSEQSLALEEDDDDATELLVRQISKLEYEEHKQEVSDRLRFQIEFAQALLKAFLLVNGASIISLLTFIGNTTNDIDAGWMWWGFASFALGLACALVSYVGAFFSQVNFMQTAAMQMWASHGRSHGIEKVIEPVEFAKFLKNGMLFMNVGILSAVASLAGFVAGAFFALKAIL